MAKTEIINKIRYRKARPSAVAYPMPEFAPVTMQFFPSICVFISSGLNLFECSLHFHLNNNKP